MAHRYNITIEPKAFKVSLSIYDFDFDQTYNFEGKVFDSIKFMGQKTRLSESVVYVTETNAIELKFKFYDRIKRKFDKHFNLKNPKIGTKIVLEKYTDSELKADTIKELWEYSTEVQKKFTQDLICDTLKERVISIHLCDDAKENIFLREENKKLSNYFIVKSSITDERSRREAQ